MQLHHQIACRECDLLVTLPVLNHGCKAVCPRCDYVLTKFHRFSRSKLFAFSTTALIFMCLTIVFPFLSIDSQGKEKTIYFVESLSSLGDESYFVVVVFLIVTTLVVPFFIMAGLNFVILSTTLSKPLPFARDVLKGVFFLQHWNMAEIFLLGILVSMVKIATLAQVDFGWSFIAFILYIISMVFIRIYLDKVQLWQLMTRPKAIGINHE